jgi:hypothetical protein
VIESHPRVRHVLARFFPHMFGLLKDAVVRPGRDGNKLNARDRHSDTALPSSNLKPAREDQG